MRLALFHADPRGERRGPRLHCDLLSLKDPGLYAVGQNGLSGMVLWGHGLHIAWAITSGRLAGRAVAT